MDHHRYPPSQELVASQRKIGISQQSKWVAIVSSSLLRTLTPLCCICVCVCVSHINVISTSINIYLSWLSLQVSKMIGSAYKVVSR